jgi:hypothetical protein
MIPLIFTMPHCEKQVYSRDCYLDFANAVLDYRIAHALDKTTHEKTVYDANLDQLIFDALERATKEKVLREKP